MSDPEYPSVYEAKYCISSLFKVLGVFFNKLEIRANLAISSGSGIIILFSNLLLIAGSSPQGILVAPRTKIPVSSFPTPYI